MELDNLEQEKSTHGGWRAGAGRPKGSTNNLSRQVKENIVDVFEMLGGKDAMAQWATSDEKNLTEFYRLYTRMAPIEQKVTGDLENPVAIKVVTGI